MPAEQPLSHPAIPSVSIATAHTGRTSQGDALGMRPMQARAWAKRGEPYLLIKSPPASGKSRALMFIALDKVRNQGLQQAIIAVPERSIGSSFANAKLTENGFFADWEVAPQWNLCNVPGIDDAQVARSKVQAVGEFLQSGDEMLVCTHATFRFAVETFGVAAFDGRLLAIDEFHHVSSNPENKLGSQLGEFLLRGKTHIVAMTGSYFRGDAVAVLAPQDEARFETVTYTYYEQLNGYQYLKALDIGYFFYSGRYLDAIMKVLDPAKKTIVHIPNVNSRESTADKYREVEEIMEALGTWRGRDEATGFHRVERPDGRILNVADLVDDSESGNRGKTLAALKAPETNAQRGRVDIIIALGMAKEGFDWIWCEHALTVGYRSSLTEIVQIIGRATRDAPGKETSRFTNLIAEPDAEQAQVAGAINDTLKAIAASLLMEQVLAPRFDFTPKGNGPKEGFDYGEAGYQEGKANVGINEETGQCHVEIAGLKQPQSAEAQRICREDLNEVVAAFVQDTKIAERGVFDTNGDAATTMPEDLTQIGMGKIVRDRYPELGEADQEAVRQHAVAALNVIQQVAKREAAEPGAAGKPNTDLIKGVRKFINVHDLSIDLIDRINPFDAAYAILARSMNEKTLRQVEAAIARKRGPISEEEARQLAERALDFQRERGHKPSMQAYDPWERKMAEGVAAFRGYVKQKKQAADAAGKTEGDKP
ncbi:MAG: DEAD/DEAH box helicase [Zoogloeaceae bacterium]|jgi:hypothetical protein|nr:DEAD/DEAH box helicase [Zoogloeaceae bacterium]